MIPDDLYELPAKGAGEEPESCPTCTRTVPEKNLYSLTGEAPFRCPTCVSHDHRVALSEQAAQIEQDWGDNEAANGVRAERFQKLSACDWTQVADAQLGTEARIAWQAYRQALRDITDFPSPADVVWPSPPS